MKVIDLLNKIANGEEVPKKIKYRDWLYEFEKDCNDYSCQYDSLLYRENDDVRQFLNDEVEIIKEDKKIEHLDIYNCFKVMGIDKTGRLDENFTDISNKINEIIDYLEGNK